MTIRSPLLPARAARRGAGAAAILAALCLGVPMAADAATVSVRPDPDSAWQDDGPGGPPTRDEVFYVAGAGERNRLLVAYGGDARSVTVTDPGATITPGDSCTAIDAHSVLCVPRPGATNPNLQSVRAELGDLDDEIATTRPGPAPIGGVVANGGPGDDRLDGGAGPDQLNGGGGTDTLLGGDGFDVVADGDVEGAPGDAAPDADVLDGGAGIDDVSYATRLGPVSVNLADPGPDGATGERDAVRGFENATGGAGGDAIVGDAGVNVLSGGAGHDTLRGLGGEDADGLGDRLFGGRGQDRLIGGAGPDLLAGGAGTDQPDCGRGADLVLDPREGEFLGRGCETVRWAFGAFREDVLTFPAQARRIGSTAVAFRLQCPRLEARDGEPSGCAGTLVLREAGSFREFGRATFKARANGRAFEVRVPLTAAARRAIRRSDGDGVFAGAFLRGRALPRVAWSPLLPA